MQAAPVVVIADALERHDVVVGDPPAPFANGGVNGTAPRAWQLILHGNLYCSPCCRPSIWVPSPSRGFTAPVASPGCRAVDPGALPHDEVRDGGTTGREPVRLFPAARHHGDRLTRTISQPCAQLR